MRKAFCLLFALSFVSHPAYADLTPKQSSKAFIDVRESDEKVEITIRIDKDYKWNEAYPAKLRFSVCNDTSCITITETIKTK